jgi:hypothetical protein
MDAIALLPLEVAGCGVARALSEHSRSSGLSRRPLGDLFLELKPLDPFELLCVAGNELPRIRKTSPMQPFQMDCARSSATTRSASRHSM